MFMKLKPEGPSEVFPAWTRSSTPWQASRCRETPAVRTEAPENHFKNNKDFFTMEQNIFV
jgi:hypothetical protein